MAIFNPQNSAKKDTLPFLNEPAPAPMPPQQQSAPPAPAPAVADFTPTTTAPPRAQPQATAPAAEPAAKESLIAADLTIEGKIEGSGNVRIAGRFKGDVNVQGDLTIETGAKLNGGVKAKKVIVAGELEGNIDSASRVELLDSSVLTGDLKAGTLTVAAGARIRGHVECGWEKDGKATTKDAKAGTDAA